MRYSCDARWCCCRERGRSCLCDVDDSERMCNALCCAEAPAGDIQDPINCERTTDGLFARALLVYRYAEVRHSNSTARGAHLP